MPYKQIKLCVFLCKFNASFSKNIICLKCYGNCSPCHVLKKKSKNNLKYSHLSHIQQVTFFVQSSWNCHKPVPCSLVSLQLFGSNTQDHSSDILQQLHFWFFSLTRLFSLLSTIFLPNDLSEIIFE